MDSYTLELEKKLSEFSDRSVLASSCRDVQFSISSFQSLLISGKFDFLSPDDRRKLADVLLQLGNCSLDLGNLVFNFLNK